jgi:uncharacterized protein with PIN domain
MANRQLNEQERELARQILADTKGRIASASKDDAGLEWAMRRYIYIRLQHDERGTPMARRDLKAMLRDRQTNRCPLCGERLPEKNAVLDRLEAMKGYTENNTRLLCPDCDKKVQAERHYA